MATRPILKQKENPLQSSPGDNIQVSESDCFKSVTTSVAKKREEHIKKTLEWANRSYDSYSQPYCSQNDVDIDMEDVSQPLHSRQRTDSHDSVEDKSTPTVPVPPLQGFKRASNLNGKRDSADFSFMRRRVRVNTVDKDVKEYSLE